MLGHDENNQSHRNTVELARPHLSNSVAFEATQFAAQALNLNPRSRFLDRTGDDYGLRTKPIEQGVGLDGNVQGAELFVQRVNLLVVADEIEFIAASD